MSDERTKVVPEPAAAWATDCRDKYAEGDCTNPSNYPGNHDSGFAGRICMADGNLAWAAVVSDGAGGSVAGLKVSSCAIQAFVDAVASSSLMELSDSAARDAWLRGWTKRLHEDVWKRFRGGHATFCGALVLPPADRPEERPPSRSGWRLFAFNVGDSQVWKLAGDGTFLGVTPDSPPNNDNHSNRTRFVGMEPEKDFPLIDMEEFPLPGEGPCWILAGSDGFFSRKKLAIFSSRDLRDLCLGSAIPFQELPARAIRRSLANAQKLGCAERMDNATVAMLGFRVPATDLAAPAGGANPAGGASAAADASSAGASPAGKPSSGAPSGNRAPATAAAVRAAPIVPKRLFVAAACTVATLAVLLGFVAGLAASGRNRANPSSPEPDPTQETRTVAAPVREEISLPEAIRSGRCAFCRGKGLDSFHWAAKCTNLDNPLNRQHSDPPDPR